MGGRLSGALPTGAVCPKGVVEHAVAGKAESDRCDDRNGPTGTDEPDLAPCRGLRPQHDASSQVNDIDADRRVVRCASDDALDHVGQPLGLIKDPIQAVSNVPTLAPGEQQDGQ